MATSASNIIYGKGDVCLKINPFDNYRLFTLYDDWTSDDRKPLDLSNGQTLYLVFKSKKKEIRIPECSSVDTGYSVDKVNGQVLFKISQKNATDILAMDSNVFYITRIYETNDIGYTVGSSDEEVIYTGRWKDETSNTVEGYVSQILEFKNLLDERNTQISNLQSSIASLTKQNTEYATQLEELKETNDNLSAEITTLESKLAEYERGVEYSGEIITNKGSITSIVLGRQYTEQELADFAKQLEETKIN